jgi:hypothetical protein
VPVVRSFDEGCTVLRLISHRIGLPQFISVKGAYRILVRFAPIFYNACPAHREFFVQFREIPQ